MYAIALNTIAETVRRRVVAGTAATSFIAIVAIGWGFHRIVVEIQRPEAALGTQAVLTILLAFAFSVLLAVGASFLAAPAIAGEIENGIALAVLPRPISRAAYVFGKWLGLATLVASYAAIFGALAFAAISLGGGYDAPHEPEALAFLVAQSVALFTLALALGTRVAPIAGGILSVALFGVSWIAGITAAVARSLDATLLSHVATLVGLVIPTDGLWRCAVFELTPVTMLVAQDNMRAGQVNPFSTNEPPTLAFVIWSALWIVAALLGAIGSMHARDV